LQINLATPDNQIVGTISDITSNGWVSSLEADLAVPMPGYAGRYTLIIPPGANGPGGYGFATLSNNPSGQVTLSGRLADATDFSQSVAVAYNGNIPLYASLYSGKGSLQGLLTLTTNPSSIAGNDLTWIKVTAATNFTNANIIAQGSFYVPPQKGGDGVSLTNGTLTINNVTSNTALVYNNVTVSNNELTFPESGNPANKLTGVITPGTGVLTVTFRPTDATATIVAKGVVLQDAASPAAAGWFYDSTQSGSFLLQP
jgi:hypothetical protein